MAAGSNFDWTINESKTWPPMGRPRLPFGVTQVEILRSCPLRTYFEASHQQGYEPRVGFAARIGLAFHKTLESLYASTLDCSSPAAAANQAKLRMEQEIARQEELRNERPREQNLPKDETRINRALDAIIAEARKLALDQPRFRGSHLQRAATVTEPTIPEIGIGGVLIEVPVVSKDGLIAGRVDRVERSEQGIKLIDYKAALRDDIPERYERQLQIYSWLWQASYGEWPVEAQLVYPLTSRTYEVALDVRACKAVAKESKELIERSLKGTSVTQQATPGEVCQVCQFRPWCKPFWKYQSRVSSHRVALDKAYYGLEGEITSLSHNGDIWKVNIRWRNHNIRLVTPIERFPHLQRGRVGSHVRAMGMRLRGQMFRPRATANEWSELFIVTDGRNY